MNIINMDTSEEMTINDLGQRLVGLLVDKGWVVEMETDYPNDFKEYNAVKSPSADEVSSRVTVLLLTLNNDPRIFDILFIFYINPVAIKPSKRVFGKALRSHYIPELQRWVESLLKQCAVAAKPEEVTIDASPRYKLRLDNGPAVSPAYAVQLHYWKSPSAAT